MRNPRILIAEDDPDDQLLLRSAFQEIGGQGKLDFVHDGAGLLYYLEEAQRNDSGQGYPDFIILDLNMPRKNGKEALRDIKQHPVFKRIPVIIYTTTRDEHEILHCYELGANTYIVKPSDFRTMVKIVGTVMQYWFSTATIPTLAAGDPGLH